MTHVIAMRGVIRTRFSFLTAFAQQIESDGVSKKLLVPTRETSAVLHRLNTNVKKFLL